VLKDGLTSRKDVLRGFAEATGGRLIGLWGTNSGDVDFVILTEADESAAEGAAIALGQKSMGHLAEVKIYTLVDTEDVDAALQRMNTVTRAPGEA
jgi:uncharacterized protein with GYD domain